VQGDVWKVIRADFVRRWDAIRPVRGKTKAHGAKQETVATHGGLAGQNAISRILDNKKNGPSVEIFVRGLIGMGVKPSVFFAAIEDQLPIPAVEPAWARAANAATAAPTSAAEDAEELQRARLLKAGLYAQRMMFELFATRDVRPKKRR
jgi:hypothetical protein